MKNIRIGMITIYRKNYGAFLQAYALQKTLIKLGYNPEIIRYDYYKDRTILGIEIDNHQSIKQVIKKIIINTLRLSEHKARQKVFDNSIRNNIIESEEYYRDYRKLENNPPNYDIYLTGSDQVFNTSLSPQSKKARLLCFVKNGVRASYAASAGVDFIKESDKDFFEYALSNFEKISVREEGLKTFFEENYHIQVLQHIDPIFLLSKEEWNNFSSNDLNLGKYIFYYRILPQNELKEEAKRVSEQTGLPVFVADGHDSFPNQLKRNKVLSPEEWIACILNASYVVTNSFHGASFALHFRKNASILIPPKGGERVTSLLNRCRINIDSNNVAIVNDIIEDSFNNSKEFILKERERAYYYLSSLKE